MNKLNALNTEAQTKIISGKTEVIVKRREVDERTGKETIKTIHKGVVVQQTDAFLRVFNHLPQQQGGDSAPENAEWFPRDSRFCWCEVERQRTKLFPIPPLFR